MKGLFMSGLKTSKINKNKRPKFSKAILKLAKKNIKEFELEANESFLIRAKINRAFELW